MGFELGKYYKQIASGQTCYMLSYVETYYYGKCFLAETENGSIQIFLPDENASFVEISENDFLFTMLKTKESENLKSEISSSRLTKTKAK